MNVVFLAALGLVLLAQRSPLGAVARSSFDDDDLNCKEMDYEYALTECDSQRGRWRVQVPRSGRCADNNPRPARRIEQCHISCEAGFYYDLGDLSCRMCRPGTYSLGGGVLLESFQDRLPDGFTSQVETFRSSFTTHRGLAGDIDCSQFGWRARGGYLASLGGPCAATLTYDVHLVKPGNLTYTYQYPDKDVIFDFEAQNAQCQSLRDSKEFRWPQYTREAGEWKKQTVRLLTGQNVLQWKTLGMDHGQSRPVVIKSIEISGVSLTSPCLPCRAGTFSEGGARLCTECPENTYSDSEASSCRACNPVTEYASKGSPSCRPRLPCSRQDYYEKRTPCDADKQTQRVYEWIAPKICRDDLPGAEQLPLPSPRRQCAPCNPGMDYGNGSSCEPCPRGSWSDGNTACRACPPGSTPNYGIQVARWVELPSFMSAACLEPDGSTCQSGAGWQVAGTYIHTTRHHSSGAYLLLSITVAGFRSKGGVTVTGAAGGAARRLEVGRVEFSFELDCNAECEFVFLQTSDTKGMTVVESWSQRQARQTYSYAVMQNDSYTFSWAFQQLGSGPAGAVDAVAGAMGLGVDDDGARRGFVDMAKIFFINVTNTVDGGAASCLPCHHDSDSEGCLPCPPGQYMEPNGTGCHFCPPDTTAVEPLVAARLGQDACQPCGPGLHAENGGSCETNCVFDIDDYTYDLRALDKPVAVHGSRLFTASGAQYYHLFNMSLCGTSEPAECSNTITVGDSSATEAGNVAAFICRTTVIPGQGPIGGGQGDLVSDGEEQTFSTQSVALGDELLAVTSNTTYMHMKVIDEFVQPDFKDIHFFYATPLPTRSCPKGRTAVLTLRCDPSENGNSTITLPAQWPDGTSDGCNFNFMWKSKAACPACRESDYTTVKGECVNRGQAVHYLPAKHCHPATPEPSTVYVACTTQIPLEVQLVVAVSVALALMLCGCMMHFWRKTQSLEYKYMKLVQSNGGRDGDGDLDADSSLPPAESCALGEEDAEEEDVAFAAPSSQGLLNRIRAMRSKPETGNPFETVKLTMQ
ncbi:UPF0577 protein KIAA1324-like homolog [Thrips palmi]|uniref:UPF0577 protein KIAA1324-like homolog n=1 Tax=Thrips palmi TaxID=161013 RepID=A0A6P8Y4F2_THRPL|nr:UPF0577 protein KIAA1324-like homolog [Thrips palmi]